MSQVLGIDVGGSGIKGSLVVIEIGIFLEEIIKIISQSNKIPHFFQLFVFYNESIIPYISYYFNNKKMKNWLRALHSLYITYTYGRFSIN